MDHGRFDTLARLFGVAGSRRAALGTLVGVTFLGFGFVEGTDAGKRKKRRRRRKRKNKPTVCFGTNACPPPDTGKDFDDCDYSNSSIFVDANAGGSSFRRTNFAGATMDGADLQGTIFRDANLAGASMVGVDVRGASFPGACLLDADLTGHITAAGEVPFAFSFACNTRVGTDIINRDCNNLPSCCRR